MIEPIEVEKIECVHCNKLFNDDDIVSIFDIPLCDDCIDYLLKNNVSYLRQILNIFKRDSQVDKYDVDYLLIKLDKINKRSNNEK